ncbi:hypothetical protein PsorP6_007681 [Peronosclerospora sorghi]|uniref:Uncharacterized protein n=1 Tax=Peronosclerospora sorghi TaxID=230839 RepID=A0ACC0W660_9STRA|nr:hypothetical protein PsorP6_007681 [Peronosclerospora sorghi]
MAPLFPEHTAFHHRQKCCALHIERPHDFRRLAWYSTLLQYPSVNSHYRHLPYGRSDWHRIGTWFHLDSSPFLTVCPAPGHATASIYIWLRRPSIQSRDISPYLPFVSKLVLFASVVNHDDQDVTIQAKVVTSIVAISIGNFFTGVSLVCLGHGKLATTLSCLPLHVIGGYMAYTGNVSLRPKLD